MAHHVYDGEQQGAPTFWPRKRLLVERTVKLSDGDPSVVLSADTALLTSPGFYTTQKHGVGIDNLSSIHE